MYALVPTIGFSLSSSLVARRSCAERSLKESSSNNRVPRAAAAGGGRIAAGGRRLEEDDVVFTDVFLQSMAMEDRRYTIFYCTLYCCGTQQPRIPYCTYSVHTVDDCRGQMHARCEERVFLVSVK